MLLDVQTRDQNRTKVEGNANAKILRLAYADTVAVQLGIDASADDAWSGVVGTDEDVIMGLDETLSLALDSAIERRDWTMARRYAAGLNM